MRPISQRRFASVPARETGYHSAAISMRQTEVNIPQFLVFVLGCFPGLLGFSLFLSFILGQYRFPTLALLSGFTIGFLNRLWPLRKVITFRF